MKVSYNWLKEYVKKLPPPDELAKRLTMAGLEVEGIEALEKGISGVVTAQILSVEKHPNADRLSFCKVKTDKGIHSIVCGAKNMKAGDKVALALPGASLPKGIKIEKTKIRGVESEGMMCSEAELGLKDVSEGIMILPQDFPIGKDFTEAMGLNDSILNVNVTPNRPDCLSIMGIAREVAAITKTTLKTQNSKLKIQNLKLKTQNSKHITVSIKEPSLCRRYAAMVLENIKAAPSPDWLKRRLESAGFRSINNVVDITNYVMIEYGQPLHAFDYDLVSDKQIIIRRADKNEKIQTIDGFKRTLTQEMLVIADKERPIALAGIMGGKETEINDATKNILLESAWFDPSCVRRTSKALGIFTESSYRFERGVDIEGVTKPLDRAAQMIVELAGGNMAMGSVDKYPRQHKPLSIKAGLSRINKILGISIHKKEVEDCFNNLGIGFKLVKLKNKEDAMWDVAPPSFRVDLIKEIDIIEEIARLYGYEKIPATIPTARLLTTKTKGDDLVREKARDILTNNGFLEAVNYSFISPRFFDINISDIKNGLKLLNPLTEEQSIMRQSLIPGLLQTLQYNLNHNNHDIRVFEIGRIFIPKEKETEERNMISGLISGLRCKEAWNTGKDSADFYDIKGAVEQILTGLGVERYIFASKADIPFLHLGKAAVIEADDKQIGIVGEIHPDIIQRLDIRQSAHIFELDMQIIAAAVSGPKRYSPIPKYPMIVRDVAMIIEKEIPFQRIYNAINGLGIKLLEEVNVFDVYYGENIPDGKYSMALRFMYRSPDRTLTDDEVTNVHSTVLESLKTRFGVEIRGE
ncbi:MAG: phenylalanine--tRNA ligase subunit beta [Deltaproteobacteria bacterium]|nr:phenylalanine--tRNA ligase subunit beta [Deltaproteobacteria bacterium]